MKAILEPAVMLPTRGLGLRCPRQEGHTAKVFTHTSVRTKSHRYRAGNKTLEMTEGPGTASREYGKGWVPGLQS